jgi:hypothetical protein
MRRSPDICYIFHVIGTLTMHHVEMALESLRLQRPFHWKRFVLYNGSDLPTDEILALVPKEFFDTVEVYPYDERMQPTCAADWFEQMHGVTGNARYLCHKADFYLPPWTCQEFQKLPKKLTNFLILFNKFDMKSRATDDDIRLYANYSFGSGVARTTTGTYGEHLGKLAVPFEQKQGMVDGTMHGYSDSFRPLYKPDLHELSARWGVAIRFRYIDKYFPHVIRHDPRFFAVHMWHDSPDRKDWNKNQSPEERF